jgi:hypothetical protein
MPFELELPALELELVDDVAAGAEEELEDFDEDEPPPQPATAMAATAIRRAIHRRADMELIVMVLPLIPHMDGAFTRFLPGRRIRFSPRSRAPSRRR